MAEYARQGSHKQCPFCKDKVSYIDYKDIQTLQRYVTDREKIKSRRVTGVCTQHQHELAKAIKRAREMALMPYTARVTSHGSGRRNR